MAQEALAPMHQDPKGARDERAITTWDEDERDQWALLRQVLELHPATLTRDELIRELNGGRPREFSEVDRFERAIRELAGTGLLHRPGEDEMVNPTRAADLLRCKGFYNAFLKATEIENKVFTVPPGSQNTKGNAFKHAFWTLEMEVENDFDQSGLQFA